jgi:phosphoribosylglycinamide formyltransferase 1
MTKIAVFASGNGSNFQAIVEQFRTVDTHVEISLLICDKPGAFAIERAKNFGIPSFVFSLKEFESKEAYEAEILKVLKQSEIEFIVLAGYMKLVGKKLLEAYEGKMVNIHPSLLPNFPGMHGIEQAWEAGVAETGVTVHYVDSGLDTGPVIEQRKISIKPEDTLETLEAKIHAIEHEMYPKIILDLVKVLK